MPKTELEERFELDQDVDAGWSEEEASTDGKLFTRLVAEDSKGNTSVHVVPLLDDGMAYDYPNGHITLFPDLDAARAYRNSVVAVGEKAIENKPRNALYHGEGSRMIALVRKGRGEEPIWYVERGRTPEDDVEPHYVELEYRKEEGKYVDTKTQYDTFAELVDTSSAETEENGGPEAGNEKSGVAEAASEEEAEDIELLQDRAEAHFQRDYREINSAIRHRANFWTRLVYERYLKELIRRDYLALYTENAQTFASRDALCAALFGDTQGRIDANRATLDNFFGNIHHIVDVIDSNIPAEEIQFEAIAAALKRDINNIYEEDIFTMHRNSHQRGIFDLEGEALKAFAEANELIVADVELCGMGEREKGEAPVRHVLIPRSEYEEAETLSAKAELVYIYGQNDFQPNGVNRSVSLGDRFELPELIDETKKTYDRRFGSAPVLVVQGEGFAESRIAEIDAFARRKELVANRFGGVEENYDPQTMFTTKHRYDERENGFVTKERIMTLYPELPETVFDDPYFYHGHADEIASKLYVEARRELSNIGKRHNAAPLSEYSGTLERGDGAMELMPVKVKNADAYRRLNDMIDWDEYETPKGGYLSIDEAVQNELSKKLLVSSNGSNNRRIDTMVELYFDAIGITPPKSDRHRAELLERIIHSGASIEGGELHYVALENGIDAFRCDVIKGAGVSTDMVTAMMDSASGTQLPDSAEVFAPAKTTPNDMLVPASAAPAAVAEQRNEPEANAAEGETLFGDALESVDLAEATKEEEAAAKTESGTAAPALADTANIAEVHLDDSGEYDNTPAPKEAYAIGEDELDELYDDTDYSDDPEIGGVF